MNSSLPNPRHAIAQDYPFFPRGWVILAFSLASWLAFLVAASAVAWIIALAGAA